MKASDYEMISVFTVLVQFTDDLLHLQEGYVKQLENKTNAKPGKFCLMS